MKLLGWKQVVALDKERAKRIATRAATDEMDGGEVYPVVVPWEEPVTDLGAVLDELVEELGRYMSASLLFLNTTALWSVLAHLLQRDDLGINISPRLAIQSPDKRCGKTTLLEAISCVVPKPDMLTSLTPAALFRTADEFRPTFLIDEADILMRKDAAGDLLMILNAGYRRKGANVVRMEKRADGGFNRVRIPHLHGDGVCRHQEASGHAAGPVHRSQPAAGVCRRTEGSPHRRRQRSPQ